MFKHTTITKNSAHSFNYMLVVKKINFTYVYISYMLIIVGETREVGVQTP